MIGQYSASAFLMCSANGHTMPPATAAVNSSIINNRSYPDIKFRNLKTSDSKIGFNSRFTFENSRGICSITSQALTNNVSVMAPCTESLVHAVKEDGMWVDSSTYASILQMCAGKKFSTLGKQTHAHLLKNGYGGNIFLENKLVFMYAKCGKLMDARLVFDRLQNPDVFSWTPMIVEYARQGHFEETVALFYQMHMACIRQDDLILTSILKACAGLVSLQEGKGIHAYIIKSGFESDYFVGSGLVDMYSKCRNLEDAQQVFVKIYHRNIVSWNAMISGYAQSGCCDEAMKLFHQMKSAGETPDVSSWTAIISGFAQNGFWNKALDYFGQMQLANVKPDTLTISSIVQACARLEALERGMQIHGFVFRREFESDVFVGSALVDMYSKCQNIWNAREVFDKIPQKNVVSWNVMIAGYAHNGLVDEALHLFGKMQLADLKPNWITWNTMIAGSVQNGRCDEALKLFCDMQLAGVKPTVVSWTALIAGYAQNGHGNDALKLFHKMLHVGVKPNSNTLAAVLPACTDLAALQQGKSIHGYIVIRGFESDVFVGSALVDMYAKCGSINDAQLLFDKMSEKNVVTWNSIIAGYALSGHIDDALELFVQMQRVGMKPDLTTWTVMIAGYAQIGHWEEALKMFSQMKVEGMTPNVLSWTAFIAGYAQNGHCNEALKLFHQMQSAGVKPNAVSIISILPICAKLAALEEGKQIHGYSIRNQFQSDVFVGTALVDMYAKCGSIRSACQVFDKLSRKTVVTWNAMITGYALHGQGEDALSLFHQMIREGIKPDSITFTGILSACNHAGLLDEGWQYFDSMNQDYDITPKLEHYGCMVDLLGRGGYLDEAWDFIQNMPLEPDATVWGALLSACKTHCNVELGECAAKHLFELEPDNAGNYVLLSNIYAQADRWDDIRSLEEVIKELGLKKRSGWSRICIRNRVHVFSTEDGSHPQMAEIYATLQDLVGQMEAAGYVSVTNCVLENVEEEENENILSIHSEKLAIAFGLINTSPSTPLRIIKNLRVCGDCHTFAKFISKIVRREIFVRDRNRFHHFKDGLCSCGDYWSQ